MNFAMMSKSLSGIFSVFNPTQPQSDVGYDPLPNANQQLFTVRPHIKVLGWDCRLEAPVTTLHIRVLLIKADVLVQKK